MTLFARVAEVSVAVAATRSRRAKVAAMAGLLADLEPGEVVAVVALLGGVPRQGRIGIGWHTVAGLGPGRAGEATLTVAEVDDALTALAATNGPGSVAARMRLLDRLTERATPPEVDLLGRLLTGELRQGALTALVAEAVAAASGIALDEVRRATMLHGDLAEVAALALGPGGATALAGAGLVVGRPLQPMLAASAPDVATAVAATGVASVEWKLDGIRLQAHRRGGEVHLFTRNLNDVTDRLGFVAGAVRSLPATSLVLDGEAVGGEVRFFDLLHLDGSDLLDRALGERQAALDRVVGPLAVPRLVTADASEAQRFLAGALAAGHEGVVVKALASPYQAGRRGGTWRKVKPVRTLDLVVLAAEWGGGRRRGWLSNLHLGARSSDHKDGFAMVGKTFKGLTDEVLAWQTAALLAREVSREGHVVRVRPELVVEVALDGVQRSTRYPGGVALRFARVRRYRPDKAPAEADTLAAVVALCGRLWEGAG